MELLFLGGETKVQCSSNNHESASLEHLENPQQNFSSNPAIHVPSQEEIIYDFDNKVMRGMSPRTELLCEPNNLNQLFPSREPMLSVQCETALTSRRITEESKVILAEQLVSVPDPEHIVCVPEIPNIEPTERKPEDDDIAIVGRALLAKNMLPVVRRFKCDQCDQVFIKKAHLQQHASRHSGERPFICEVCNATFLRLGHLTMHLRIHSGTRPYKCTDCPAAFVDRGTLNKHRRKHTGERPYKCEYCGATFAQYGHHQQHVRTHNGERPFVCQVCKSTFTRIGHLQGHVRIHTGERPHECAECGATFVEKAALLKHLRVHTGERPFKCAHCDAAFTQKGHMHRHCRIHCPEESRESEIVIKLNNSLMSLVPQANLTSKKNETCKA